MKKCYDCTHVEMCGWRKEVKEQGCEFFSDGMVWIPVSEKLPKDPRPVFVTILWHEPYDNYEVSIEEYWDNGDGWGEWPGAEIIAWMPLPEPYKGEANEKM